MTQKLPSRFSNVQVSEKLMISSRFSFLHNTQLLKADTVLLFTCAVRDSAEEKIWRRMMYFNSVLKKQRRSPLSIGILGCMAERLREKLIHGRVMGSYRVSADFVCGPDAYRDLPRLIEDIQLRGIKGASLALSLEETYANIKPVRQFGPSAFLSVMRGCDNMCSYCIVPFVRGRERSRPLKSIIEELYQLSYEVLSSAHYVFSALDICRVSKK